MPSIIFLVFRRLRAPLILLIAIYAMTVLGFSLIPGVDDQGRPTPPMSFFHAFYFVSYTATTIGFGELPVAFSNAQRMWTLATIYLSVVGWSYLLFKLFAIAQDQAFQQAVANSRFERSVRRSSEPFYLICGCGETGMQLLKALDRMDVRCVVVDLSQSRIDELEIEDLGRDVESICGDVRSPQLLQLAGLTHRMCRAVIALTNDDSANLAVCATARLLNPDLQVIARVLSTQTAANMASFGTRHIINPFEKFADYLQLAMREPEAYRLLDWLLALPGTRLKHEDTPPHGLWVLCGHGRFGSVVGARLAEAGAALRIIDPATAATAGDDVIRGVGTVASVLEQAGLRDAQGVIIGTDDDVTNLAIAVTAREINPHLFVAIRQNLVANHRLFEAIKADVLMVSSQIIAHECFALLTAPLLGRFLAVVQLQRDAWAHALIERLRGVVGDRAPELWSMRIDRNTSPALFERVSRSDLRTTLADLLHDPLERERDLQIVPLLLVRSNGAEVVLPKPSEELRAMTGLLLAGTREARSRLELAMRNANELEYVCTGIDQRGGWLGKKLAALLSAR